MDEIPTKENDPMMQGDAYGKIANGVSHLTHDLIRSIHNRNAEMFPQAGGANAAPLIQGIIGGLLSFMIMDGGMSDEETRALLSQSIDESIPQIRMHLAADALGAVGQGSA